MIDLEKARKRLTGLANGLRTFETPEGNKIYDKAGKVTAMSKMQAKVFSAYARQIERVIEEVLSD